MKLEFDVKVTEKDLYSFNIIPFFFTFCNMRRSFF